MKKVIEKCKKAEVYMYLIPSMVIFSIFLFYPFFKTIYLSQLMLTCSNLFTIPIVGFKIILKIMAPELDATAIGSA